jgi:hypothetical protein
MSDGEQKLIGRKAFNHFGENTLKQIHINDHDGLWYADAIGT